MTTEIRICDDHSGFEIDVHLQRLKTLIADARKIGCEAALKKHHHDIDYLIDGKRAAYIDLLGIKSDEDVLEIGASMGQHTRLIGKLCRRLDALEVVAKQAEFAKLWCEQSGLENVRFTAGGASGKLPYGDQSFDVVVMNYVLEWSAGRDALRADEFHLRLLSEIHRVLNPGGRFFVSTKNRYGLRLVTGSLDEHLGIRFGNALPRWLSRALSKNVDRDIPRGYLHSRGALEKLLRAAGFNHVDAYLSFPDARRPDVILPFENERLKELTSLDASRYSRKDRLYLSLPPFLKQHLATSHTFIATRAK